ncbi:hypothetical protein Tco_1486278 [Tanacetum coccineum]
MSVRITDAVYLSPSSFLKRYRSTYETSSSSSPTLPHTKEDEEDESSDVDDERESQGLDDEGQGLDDEGHEEEVVPEGQQQAVPVVETAASEPLGLGYGGLRHHELAVREDQPTLGTWLDHEDGRVYTDIPAYIPQVAPVQTLPSPEWSFGSLPVSPASPVVSSPIASPVATLTTTISVDEDQFIKVGAQLELYGSILHDLTQRLDALPPTLVTNIDRDVRELYTRSRAVRDETFSQRYRFRSLEREHERAIVTFGALWRPVMTLKAWAGHVDTRLADMSRDRYDDHRLIHDVTPCQGGNVRRKQEWISSQHMVSI